MRAGPLSDAATQKHIRGYFIPVQVSRDRYLMPPASREESLFVRKMDDTRREKKLIGGTVAVYLVDADGTTRDCLRVQDASQPDVLADWLDKHIQAHRLSKREHVLEMKNSSQPEGDAFVLRTRLHTKPDLGMGRDTIALSPKQLAGLLPTGERTGSHDLPAATADALLRLAYPPLPWYQAKVVKVETATLQLTFRDATHARITGKLKLIYPALGRPTDGTVDATLVGEAIFDEAGNLLQWVLVSDKATYTNSWEGKSNTRNMDISLEFVPAKGATRLRDTEP
jgi:hypothetical protein